MPELGLELALIIAQFLLKTDDLHYGYWADGVTVEAANLKAAQEAHSAEIMRSIPPGVRTILDVGAGVGVLAQRLKEAGYAVDCVSPSAYLSGKIRERLGSDTTVFDTRFESLETDCRYDLVLFSESFQYIKLEQALPTVRKFLRPHGHLLICDFFRLPMPERGPFGGGHPLQAFYDRIAECRFATRLDRDITAQTAPNLDLTQDFFFTVVQPIKDRLCGFLRSHYNLPYRLVRWTLRKPLRHLNGKYFSGTRTGANFARYKSYRLMLFQQI